MYIRKTETGAVTVETDVAALVESSHAKLDKE